jgi:predicted O-methyltransferase YrrM
VIADNVFRRAAYASEGEDPGAVSGIVSFNETLARSGLFRATMLPLEDGFAVGVRL